MTSTSIATPETPAVRYRFARFELLPSERQLLAQAAPVPAPVRIGPHAELEQARDAVMFARARAALGNDAEFDRAWSEGRAMPFEQAAEYALRI